MARITDKKIIKWVFSLLMGSAVNAYAIEPTLVIKDILGSKAGGKFYDENGGKDVEKYTKPYQCLKHTPWGEPRIKDEAVFERTLYLCNTKFYIQYDPKLKMPLSTSEIFLKNTLLSRAVPLSAKYKPDERFPTKIQQQPQDYINSPYVPMQLATIYNMDLATFKSDPNVAQEYLNFSNVVPMIGNNLANTIWSDLEHQVRVWVMQKNKLLVTTGIIYLNGKTNGNLPYSKTLVPTHFYKIITNTQNHGTVSFIIPNKEIYTAKTKKINDPNNIFKCGNGPCTLSNFIVPIQEVERLTNTEMYPTASPHWSTKIKLDSTEMYKHEKRAAE